MIDILKRFRDPEAARSLAKALSEYKGKQLNIMEVCGTHTMAVFRHGIRDLLPDTIRLVSGPGCPVCVTASSFIDAAISIALEKDVVVCTFGDLLKVPGSGRSMTASGGAASLAAAKTAGADVRIVYSPLDAVAAAAENPGKKVVFISVGFETTTPVVALSAIKAREMGMDNFLLLSANKTMPEALKLLAGDSTADIGGFLYPGHVTAVTGTEMYGLIAENFGVPGVVAGFEPLDILHAIYTLTEIINKGKARVVNEYSRVVRDEGNPAAMETMYEVFQPCDSAWRGLGTIPGSGLAVREKYERMDAWKAFGIAPADAPEPAGCRCGEVLKGRAVPEECGLFRRKCTPETPVGACMVSSEGTCAAYYRYKGENRGDLDA